MPRKKKEQKLVKYYMPIGLKEQIDEVVDNSSFYKRKASWKQKFYYLFDYISEQNILRELDTAIEYVNIHQETMAHILGIDNHQIATILRHSCENNLLKKDGIWNAAAISKQGRKKVYAKEGKSYGYQIMSWQVLEEIIIVDNRCMNEKILNNTWEKTGKHNSDLKEYHRALSFIKIDETNIEEIRRSVIENKQKKKRQKENYEMFIKQIETEFTERNNKTNIIIPFDGVIVPIRNDAISKAACSYLNIFQGGVIVPCHTCKYEVKQFSKRKKQIREAYDEPEQTTIARCNKALYIINNGHMIPIRHDNKSRVYCSVTNLNREFRKAILLDGKKIIGLDIANSQPLLASILIKQYWLKRGSIPADVVAYQQDCEAGVFYDNFMRQINIREDLKSQFKQDFFRKVFFSKVIEKNNALKDMFIKKYPNCWDALCELKGGLYSMDYNEFAKGLQEIEAAMIFDNVNMDLIRRGIKAFNIFDLVYVDSRENYEIVKQLIIKAFNEFDVKPTLRLEYEEHLIENERQVAISKNTSELTKEERDYIEELDEVIAKNEKRRKEQEAFRQYYLNRSVRGQQSK